MRERPSHQVRTILLAGLGAMLVASAASAGSGETSAFNVYQIVAGTTSNGPTGDWFHLDTTSAFSTCLVFESRVAFKIQGDERGRRILSQLQAALLAGKRVQVGYDTTKLMDGYCIAQWVRLVK